ncbi:hypothetical protein PN36_21460 [Candidatus Thiomargarita nelsonii]|uniref:Uncharacterized protein n=1 Tax=Candidatus Thiomargarita nelsonii TaxID=1003181 RepID=A0A4E0QNW0_9GAMM|nr:hypothetical protein PN36_21460 [Candidatus Thiomargarita nelsonii]
MKFSTREIYFLIEAVEYRIQSYEKRLKSDMLTDDEYSDIVNDKGVLEILLETLKEKYPNQTASAKCGMIVRLQDTTEYLLSTVVNRKYLSSALEDLKKPEIYISINLTEL